MTNFANMAPLNDENPESSRRLGNADEKSLAGERHLPCNDPPSLENDPNTPAKVDGGLRILVVDDNRDSAETMGMLLEIEGHEILLAHDGKKAVEIALVQQPDAILLDLGLPYLNGYDACRAMRMGGLTNTLIVAMTGYGQDEDRRLSHEAGFDAHLVKPADLLAIRELLARHR
jgi:CheY-like chemotaxis protein